MDHVFCFLIQYSFQDLFMLLLCTFSSLLLTTAQKLMVCIHHILFMHSPEVGDLD